MKNKILAALAVSVLGVSMLLSGCGTSGEAVVTPTPEPAAPTATPIPTATPAPTATPTPVPMKTIGTEVPGAFEVKVTNATNKVISGVEVMTSKTGEYGSNLLVNGDTVTLDEKRMFYYSPGVVAEGEEAPTYNVRLTFDDGVVLEMHNFPFGDMNKCKFLASDGVAYVEYKSVSTKEKVSTKEAELAIVAEAEAAAAAAAEQQAYEEQQTYYEAPSYDYSSDYSYSEPSYSYDYSYEAPSYDYSYDYSEPSYEGGGDDGGDACLNDGLLN